MSLDITCVGCLEPDEIYRAERADFVRYLGSPHRISGFAHTAIFATSRLRWWVAAFHSWESGCLNARLPANPASVGDAARTESWNAQTR